MNIFYLKYKQELTGPFTLTQLSNVKLHRSMLFSLNQDTSWQSMPYFPEIEEIYRKQKKRFQIKIKIFVSIIVLIIIGIIIYFLFIFKSGSKEKTIVKDIQPDEIQYTSNEKVLTRKHKRNSKTASIPNSDLEPILQKEVTSIPSVNELSINTSGIDARKKYIRNHIAEFFRTNRSNYSFVENAGIQDVSVVVENMSEFVVDELTVRVDYLSINRDIINSEYVVFENIAPYRLIRKKSPSHGNARSVVFFIVSLKSKALTMFFTPERAASNASDPFLFKH